MEDYFYETSEPVVSMCAEPTVKYGTDDSDKLLKMIDFIIQIIKTKYPFIGIDLKKDNYYDHYELVFDNHKTFYSYDFTVLIGEIDCVYLTPNKINNIFFTLDYSSDKKENDFEETFICETETVVTANKTSNQDKEYSTVPELHGININNLAA